MAGPLAVVASGASVFEREVDLVLEPAINGLGTENSSFDDDDLDDFRPDPEVEVGGAELGGTLLAIIERRGRDFGGVVGENPQKIIYFPGEAKKHVLLT